MSQFGYRGKGLEFLTNNKIEVGSQVKIHADLVYSGVIMPRLVGIKPCCEKMHNAEKIEMPRIYAWRGTVTIFISLITK